MSLHNRSEYRLAVPAALAVILLLPTAAPAQEDCSPAELLATDGMTGDNLGWSVAIDGSTIVVGAPYADTTAGIDAGAAYVFEPDAGVWSQRARLTAPDGATLEYFGDCVAISGDTIVVGAPNHSPAAGENAGAVYVFVRVPGTSDWTYQATLIPAEATTATAFGTSVAIDGDTIVAGAANFNASVGAAFAFVRAGGVWTQQAMLSSPDSSTLDAFGVSLALEGDTAVIGAYVHFSDGGTGAAYVFQRAGSAWSQVQKLTGADNPLGAATFFGYGVDIEHGVIVVGAYGQLNPPQNQPGSVHVYIPADGLWTHQAKLTPPDGLNLYSYGHAVAIDDDKVIVGAYWDDTTAGEHAGAAYVYVWDGEGWSLSSRLTASNGEPDDLFARSVAADNATTVFGADWDDTAAGVDSGATYIFKSGCVPAREVIDDITGPGVTDPTQCSPLCGGGLPLLFTVPALSLLRRRPHSSPRV